MIRQILFDCGGVLMQSNFREVMLRLCGSPEMANNFDRFLRHPDSPWALYDKGVLTTEAVVAELKKSMPEAYHTAIEQFVETWLEDRMPIPGMEELILELQAKGYPCYLLSNFPETFHRLIPQIPVLSKLDGAVISHQVKMVKPNPEIYLYTAAHFGISPSETLFVDDSLKNVEAARNVGMEGYLFRNPEDFRQYLYQRNILSSQ